MFIIYSLGENCKLKQTKQTGGRLSLNLVSRLLRAKPSPAEPVALLSQLRSVDFFFSYFKPLNGSLGFLW